MKLASGSNLTQQLNHISDLKFSDLAQDLSKTNAKFDSKSIRLIYQEKGTQAETVNIKVHTTRTNILRNKDERSSKRKDAHRQVSELFGREFKMTEVEVKLLFNKLGIKSDRVSLKDIKNLAKEASLIRDSEAILNGMEGGTSIGTHADIVRMSQQPLRLEQTTKLKEMLLNISNAATPKACKEAFIEFERLMETTTAIPWMQRMPKSTEQDKAPDNFKNIRDSLRDNVRNQMSKLRDEALSEYCNLNLDKTPPFDFKGGKVILPESQISDFKNNIQDKLSTLEPKAFELSKQGATGSLTVKDNNLPGTGALVKFEFKHVADSCNEISDYISYIQSKIDLPIDGMLVKTTTPDPKLLNTLEEAIKGSKDKIASSKALPKLQEARRGDSKMVTAMFIQGATDITSLSIPQRLQLIQNDQFSKSLGNVMVLGAMFGLGDHIGIDGQQRKGNTNIQNMMINPSNGRLALIDYAHHDGGRTYDKNDPSTYFVSEFKGNKDYHSKTGFSAQNLIQGFKLITQFAKNLGDNPQVLDNLIGENGYSTSDAGPFRELLDSIFTNSHESNLFHTSEKVGVDLLKPEDRPKFLLNACLGALDSLELIAKNGDVFLGREPKMTGNDDKQDQVNNKPKVTPMFENPEQVIEGIKLLAKDLGKVRENLVKLL